MFEQKEFRFIMTIIFWGLFYVSIKAILEFFGVGFDTYGPYLAWFFGLYILFNCLDTKRTYFVFE